MALVGAPAEVGEAVAAAAGKREVLNPLHPLNPALKRAAARLLAHAGGAALAAPAQKALTALANK